MSGDKKTSKVIDKNFCAKCRENRNKGGKVKKEDEKVESKEEKKDESVKNDEK